MPPKRFKKSDPYKCAVKAYETIKCSSELLISLKDEPLSKRHWKVLMKKAGIPGEFKKLELGLLWDSNLLAHQQSIDTVIKVARGEEQLDGFIQLLGNIWKKPSLSS